jgi:hypothetical protein
MRRVADMRIIMRNLSRWQMWFVAVAVVAVLATVASACPSCKEGLDQNDPHHQSVAAGFYYSILFMLSMPYIILGSFGYLAYLSIRRAKGRQEAGPSTNDDAPMIK